VRLTQLTFLNCLFVCLQYRVRPGPDPRRQASETEWMTGEQIERETYKKSHGWLAAGSGTIGQVYVEVLGCNGLPNKDATPLHINFEFAPNYLFPRNFNLTPLTK